MEILSSYAISIAAGITLEYFQIKQQTVKVELKYAFEKALKQWCENDSIRKRKTKEFERKLFDLYNTPEKLSIIQTKDFELYSFLEKYEEIISEYHSAYNYLKEIKDVERYKKIIEHGITIIESVNQIKENVQTLRQEISTIKGLSIEEKDTISTVIDYEENTIENLPDVENFDYTKNLSNHFSLINHKGLHNNVSLPIDKIFIPLQLASLNNYLEQKDDSTYSDFFFKEICDIENDFNKSGINLKKLQKVHIDIALANYKKLVLLGNPASGKTTILKYLAYSFSMGKKKDTQGCFPGLPHLYPVFLSIKGYEEQILQEGIYKTIVNQFTDEQSKNAFLKYWKLGRCIILLDGLDEVSFGSRIEISKIVDNFLLSSLNDNYCIISSRRIGYESVKLDNVQDHLLLFNLSPSQIDSYFESWYLCVKENKGIVKTTFSKDEIKKQINSQSVKRICENPLLLTITLNLIVHDQIALPENAIALYEKLVGIIINKWPIIRSSESIHEHKRLSVRKTLEDTAFWLHNAEKHEIDEHNLKSRLGIINEHDFETITQIGLLEERGAEKYTFTHLTFQEYLAACKIADMEHEEISEFACKHAFNPRWHVILSFCIEIIAQIKKDKEKANKIFRILVDCGKESAFYFTATNLNIIKNFLSDYFDFLDTKSRKLIFHAIKDRLFNIEHSGVQNTLNGLLTNIKSLPRSTKGDLFDLFLNASSTVKKNIVRLLTYMDLDDDDIKMIDIHINHKHLDKETSVFLWKQVKIKKIETLKAILLSHNYRQEKLQGNDIIKEDKTKELLFEIIDKGINDHINGLYDTSADIIIHALYLIDDTILKQLASKLVSFNKYGRMNIYHRMDIFHFLAKNDYDTIELDQYIDGLFNYNPFDDNNHSAYFQEGLDYLHKLGAEKVISKIKAIIKQKIQSPEYVDPCTTLLPLYFNDKEFNEITTLMLSNNIDKSTKAKFIYRCYSNHRDIVKSETLMPIILNEYKDDNLKYVTNELLKILVDEKKRNIADSWLKDVVIGQLDSTTITSEEFEESVDKHLQLVPNFKTNLFAYVKNEKKDPESRLRIAKYVISKVDKKHIDTLNYIAECAKDETISDTKKISLFTLLPGEMVPHEAYDLCIDILTNKDSQYQEISDSKAILSTLGYNKNAFDRLESSFRNEAIPSEDAKKVSEVFLSWKNNMKVIDHIFSPILDEATMSIVKDAESLKECFQNKEFCKAINIQFRIKKEDSVVIKRYKNLAVSCF